MIVVYSALFCAFVSGWNFSKFSHTRKMTDFWFFLLMVFFIIFDCGVVSKQIMAN